MSFDDWFTIPKTLANFPDEMSIQQKAIEIMHKDKELAPVSIVSKTHFDFMAQSMYQNVNHCHYYINSWESYPQNEQRNFSLYSSSFAYLIDIIVNKIHVLWNFLIPKYVKVHSKRIKLQKVPTLFECMASYNPKQDKSILFATSIELIEKVKDYRVMPALQALSIMVQMDALRLVRKELKKQSSTATSSIHKEINFTHFLLSIFNLLLVTGGDPKLANKKQRFRKSLKYLKRINECYCSKEQKIIILVQKAVIEIKANKTPVIAKDIQPSQLSNVCTNCIHNFKLKKYNNVHIQIHKLLRNDDEHTFGVTMQLLLWISLYANYKTQNDINSLTMIIHDLAHKYSANPELQMFHQIFAQLLVKEYDYIKKTKYIKNNQIITVLRLTYDEWDNLSKQTTLLHHVRVDVCDTEVTYTTLKCNSNITHSHFIDKDAVYLQFELFDKIKNVSSAVGYPAMVKSTTIRFDYENNEKVKDINKMNIVQKINIIVKLQKMYPHIALKFAQNVFPNLKLLRYDSSKIKNKKFNKLKRNINVEWQQCLDSLLEDKKRKIRKLCFYKRCNKKAITICSGCWLSWYCSKRCQKFDWKIQHRIHCYILTHLNEKELYPIIVKEQLKQIYKSHYNIYFNH